MVHTPGSEEVELSCVSPPVKATAAAAIMTATSAHSSLCDVVFGTNNSCDSGFSYDEWASTIEVVNGRMPGLKHGVRYLSYQVCGHGLIQFTVDTVSTTCGIYICAVRYWAAYEACEASGDDIEGLHML